jgi:signal transduction histidine kinase
LVNVLLSAEYVTMNGSRSLLVMLTDITVQELQQASISQLEKAVAERTEQLELEVEHLHRFLSMISHEYRTPLAIIRGNLDLIDLKHKSGDFSNTREMGKIKRAIDRLVEVMEVSIQESRILDTQMTVGSTNFEIVDVVTSQLEAFRSMWPEREVRSTGNLLDSRVSGEASLLKMAIFNLLDNAHKYSQPDTSIEIVCVREGDEAVITIQNHGKGITGGEGEEFFEKYRRGSNAANTGGAGIGLWLVRSIIEQHHGQVSLVSTESGVEATVRLPLVH